MPIRRYTETATQFAGSDFTLTPLTSSQMPSQLNIRKNRLADALLHHIRRERVLLPGSSCLIAISGGGDSVALTVLLASLRQVLGLRLYAAHINHGLRAEADADADFVRALCSHLQIPLAVKKSDVGALARRCHISVEDMGRQVRYHFFRKVIRQFGCSVLVTAHTASDQAETLLMRIIAGTGLNGLRGIRPCRDFGDAVLYRPLLPFSGAELRQYLRERGQSWREDYTNHIPTAPRTKVRLQLLPLLEQWNPQIVEALNRLNSQVRRDNALLARLTKRLVEQCQPHADGFTVPCAALAQAHSALRQRALLSLLQKMRCQARFAHIKALDRLVRHAPTPGSCSLPNGVMATVQGDTLHLSTQAQVSTIPSCQLVPNDPLGTHTLPEWHLTLTVELAPISQRPQPLCIYLNPETINEPLQVRSRRDGDSFRPAGNKGKTKLKKYLNELGIPAHQRDSVPLLCCGNRIVWVVGYRAEQHFLAHPHQAQVWRITASFAKATDRG